MADGEGAETPQCSVIALSKTYKTKCKHEFHQSCIANYSRTHTTCSSCQAVCFEKPATPSQNTRQQMSQVLTASGNTPMGFQGSAGLGASQTEFIENTVKSAIQGMQNELLTMLSDKMAKLIEPTGINISEQEEGVDMERQIPVDHTGVQAGSGRGTPKSFTSDLRQRPDEVGHILSSWKLRFSGCSDGISVDNFIYRVQALTEQTLEGDYWILSSNANLLFEGKAREFY